MPQMVTGETLRVVDLRAITAAPLYVSTKLEFTGGVAFMHRQPPMRRHQA